MSDVECVPYCLIIVGTAKISELLQSSRCRTNILREGVNACHQKF